MLCRVPRPVLLGFLLALSSAIAWFAWSAEVFGTSCGWTGMPGPNGPGIVTFLACVLGSAAAVGVRAAHKQRRWIAILTLGVLAGATTAFAIGGAELAYAISRHCFR